MKKKDMRNEGLSDFLINRKIAKPLTILLSKTPLTPNMISIICLITGIVAAFFYALGDYKYIVIGAIIWYLSFILDRCDGEVARIKNMSSKFGAWFDDLIDRFKDGILFIAISIGVFHRTNNPLILILGMFALFNIFFMFISKMSLKELTKKDKPQILVKEGVYFEFDATTTYFLLLMTFLDKLYWVIVIYATLGGLFWIIKLFRAITKRKSIG